MASPLDTTSTRSPSISAIPAGCRGDVATPDSPSRRASLSGAVAYPCAGLQAGVQDQLAPDRRTRHDTQQQQAGRQRDQQRKHHPRRHQHHQLQRIALRRPGSAPGRPGCPGCPARLQCQNRESRKSPAPAAPVRPTASSISSQPASCTSQWPHRISARLVTPSAPGTPNPGVRSSTMMPSMATVISIELTIGLVSTRTSSSAQFGLARRISAPAQTQLRPAPPPAFPRGGLRPCA